jgi:hypothetical protein
MLDPRDRTLLLEALRPPAGHEFDRAVGTSFSLDPTALLAVPLALAAFDVQSEERIAHSDSLALLEAMRRCARRVSVFCQTGRIAVPAKYRSLLTYLEKSIVEVTPPTAGYVFHPKVWVVRYVSGDSVVYRFLCLTRNLTFDRSWDTALVLEGPLVDRKNAISANHPLGDFVATLPDLAVRDVPKRVADDVALIQDEVRRVRFAPPEGFSAFRFMPLGLAKPGPLPFAFGSPMRKGLVVAPFLSDGLLDRLPSCSHGRTLVSLDESLLAIDPATLESFSENYVIAAAAELTPDGDDDTPDEPPLSGLHAKLFVFDRVCEERESRIWTGSANATQAAFGGNVEFLVELRGPRSVCGVDAIVGEAGKNGLIGLLEEFLPPDQVPPVDEVKRALEHRLEQARREVASLPLRLVIECGSQVMRYGVSLRLAKGRWAPAKGVEVRAWPVSVPEDRSVKCGFGERQLADFGELSLEAVTPFVGFRLTAEQDGQSQQAAFVLNLPMDGKLPDRESLVLRQMIRRPQDLIALLLLLLADDELSVIEALGPGGDGGTSASGNRCFDSRGLLEALVRQLDRDPHKLCAVKRLVDDLREAQDAFAGSESDMAVELDTGEVSLLPLGFDEIWQPVWATARQLGVGDA